MAQSHTSRDREKTTVSVYRSVWRELHARSTADDSSLADTTERLIGRLDELEERVEELERLEARLDQYETQENGGDRE